MSFEAGSFGDGDGWGEVIGGSVFVGDIFDEEHEEDVVLVLAGVHAAAEFVAGGPEGGVEVGFLDCHGLDWAFVARAVGFLRRRGTVRCGVVEGW